MRTVFVAGIILVLLAVLYANAVGNAARTAHSNAAIRLIGEAIDDNDFGAVRNAISQYNERGKSPSVIVEALSNRKRPQLVENQLDDYAL